MTKTKKRSNVVVKNVHAKIANVTLIVLTVVIAKTIRTVTNAKIAIIKDIAANNITIDIIIKADVVKGAVDL
ncbi:hypothetical protein [Coprobacter secundus]|uniref:Uncharacterized protein n=1 Tax=Coprobacter secundus subsp. similis TaxID=2751153 RepID=A0A7G1HUI4_9BACT|nr:hypothetical protein [Coprobacter secundus]BCI63210.1 hypothetical protein Cop2CBH44_15630 [Coprobacter secundus subsp. similis]CCY38700.1 unknown [Tannerella sp. CAG:118]